MVTMITFTLCFFLFLYICVYIELTKSTDDIACNTGKKSCSRVIDKREKNRTNIDHALHQIHIVVAHTSMNKKEKETIVPGDFDRWFRVDVYEQSMYVLMFVSFSFLKGLKCVLTIEKKQKNKFDQKYLFVLYSPMRRHRLQTVTRKLNFCFK